MTAHPYRSAELPERAPDAPREIVYLSRDQERHVAPGRLLFQAMIVGGFAAIALSIVGMQEVGLGIFAATIAFGLWRWRRARDIEGVRLAVDDGELTVAPRNGAPPLLSVPLRDLLNVELETKTIQRLVRDTSIGAPYARTTVGPAADVTRIVLVPRAPDAPVALTDAFVPHAEASEEFARIRRFLRAHGWLPVDERPKKKKVTRSDT